MKQIRAGPFRSARQVSAEVMQNEVGDAEVEQHDKKTYGESLPGCAAMSPKDANSATAAGEQWGDGFI